MFSLKKNSTLRVKMRVIKQPILSILGIPICIVESNCLNDDNIQVIQIHSETKIYRSFN